MVSRLHEISNIWLMFPSLIKSEATAWYSSLFSFWAWCSGASCHRSGSSCSVGCVAAPAFITSLTFAPWRPVQNSRNEKAQCPQQEIRSSYSEDMLSFDASLLPSKWLYVVLMNLVAIWQMMSNAPHIFPKRLAVDLPGPNGSANNCLGTYSHHTIKKTQWLLVSSCRKQHEGSPRKYLWIHIYSASIEWHELQAYNSDKT